MIDSNSKAERINGPWGSVLSGWSDVDGDLSYMKYDTVDVSAI